MNQAAEQGIMRILLLAVLGLWCTLVCCVKGVEVDQSPPTLNVREGLSFNLWCNFSTSPNNVQWFHQNPEGQLLSLLYIPSGRKEKGRLTASTVIQERHSSLNISSAQMTDSGIYFCAVDQKDWGYTDKLIFGKGTQLTVEPKNQRHSTPSVFVMKNETNVACLVKDFYPKEISISLNSNKMKKEFEPAIAISPSGKYSAVKLGQYDDADSVTCTVKHDNIVVNSTEIESKTGSSGSVKPTEPQIIKQVTESQHVSIAPKKDHKPKVTFRMERVNMMSLTVLGLRIVFAKSVAFNFLLTVKLFFF